MYKCPVCGKERFGLICENCGYDESCDAEKYPTLSSVNIWHTFQGLNLDREDVMKQLAETLYFAARQKEEKEKAIRMFAERVSASIGGNKKTETADTACTEKKEGSIGRIMCRLSNMFRTKGKANENKNRF